MKPSLIDVPLSTYRLQLGSHLRFADVRQLVGYLRKLGVGTAYISPFFWQRVPGARMATMSWTIVG